VSRLGQCVLWLLIHSLCGWLSVLSSRERTRPRVRSQDTPVTEDPLPHSVTGAVRGSVAVLINDAAQLILNPIAS
jgi:hypothetical protein